MLRGMSYVYTVYEEKSFSKAAKRLNVSQPALSLMVKKVEAELGAALFDRCASPIRLTPAGEYYIGCVERMMKIEAETAEHFHVLPKSQELRLNLGGSTFFCTYVFPPVVRRFHERCGDVAINWTEGKNAELVEQMEQGNLDFILEVDDLSRQHDFGSVVWGTEHLILAVPQSLAVNGLLFDRRLTAADINGRRHLDEASPAVEMAPFSHERFLLLKRGNDSYERAIAICRRAGFKPAVEMQVDQMLTAYYLAEEGNGIAFVQDTIFSYISASPKLCYYRLQDKQAARLIRLYYRRNRENSPAVREFLHFVRTNLGK